MVEPGLEPRPAGSCRHILSVFIFNLILIVFFSHYLLVPLYSLPTASTLLASTKYQQYWVFIPLPIQNVALAFL